jgi:hypothetical protein
MQTKRSLIRAATMAVAALALAIGLSAATSTVSLSASDVASSSGYYDAG